VHADYWVDVVPAGQRPIPLAAYEGVDKAFAILAGKPFSRAMADGDAMIGPAFAREHDLRPGSRFRLPAPGRYITLRVGGIWRAPEQAGYSVSVRPDILVAGWGPQPAIHLWARPAPGATPASVVREMRAANLHPGLVALAPEEFISRFTGEIDAFVQPFWVLQRLLLLVALVAAVSTLLLVGYQRRREHAMLAAVGMAPAGLLRVTIIEGAGVAVVGAGLGLAASVLIGFAFFFAAGVLFGLQPPVGFHFGPGLRYAVLGVVIVLAGAAWPAWRTSRLDVIDALRYE
jgi:putative ABC transport system permease protein